MYNINPLKTQLNPIRHLLALLGAHHILHISRIRVNQSISTFCISRTFCITAAMKVHIAVPWVITLCAVVGVRY